MQVSLDVLIVAAHAPELAPVAGVRADGHPARVGGLWVAVAPVGIGLPAAAAGTALALVARAPALVVFTGSAGAYASRRPAQGVVVARTVRLVSTAAVEGRGGMPVPMDRALAPDAPLADALARHGAERADVATTLAITTDDALAERIAEATGCDVEHLEAYAVASACARAGVPCAFVLGLANRVGRGAREEWVRRHVEADAAAAAVVSSWLAAGAPRAP